jgi:hypothetical protein|tara:strand:- start:114 stop:482 length:369 start_codon:yes stop_codon:yes gene_type:complete
MLSAGVLSNSDGDGTSINGDGVGHPEEDGVSIVDGALLGVLSGDGTKDGICGVCGDGTEDGICGDGTVDGICGDGVCGDGTVDGSCGDGVCGLGTVGEIGLGNGLGIEGNGLGVEFISKKRM